MSERNIAASIYGKLRNEARTRGLDMTVLLRRYAQERLLYRLSVSEIADEFCVKGGILMTAYNGGNLLRPTEDIDFNGFRRGASAEILRQALGTVLATEVDDDGVRFDMSSMSVEKDRVGIISGGKIKMNAFIHTARVDLRVDVGFGNPITPGVRRMEMPTLLDTVAPRPRVLAYPLETVFSEKLHAMAAFGAANTRLKDFYDLHVVVGAHEFDCSALAQAVRNTFAAQERPIPDTPLACLTVEYASERDRAWKVFLDRIDAGADAPSLRDVVAKLSEFAHPVLDAAKRGVDPSLRWIPSSGWGACAAPAVPFM